MVEEEHSQLINRNLVASEEKKTKNSSSCHVIAIACSITAIIVSVIACTIAGVMIPRTNHLISSSQKQQQDPCYHHPITCNPDPDFTPRMSHVPKSVLVVAAHPDDIETSCGGTLNQWASSGSIIHYVMITNGDKGTRNRSMTSEELGRIRKQEQRNAGAVIGVKDIFFLNVPDGDVQNNDMLRYNLTYYIRLLRPEVVLTWDPTWHLNLFQLGLEHRDHRTSGQATIDAVWPTSNDFMYYPEQNLPTYRPKTILLFRFWKNFEYELPQSQVFVELSEMELQTKIRAMWEHKSQIPDDKAREAEKLFLTDMATKFGKVEGVKYAEFFTVVRFMT